MACIVYSVNNKIQSPVLVLLLTGILEKVGSVGLYIQDISVELCGKYFRETLVKFRFSLKMKLRIGHFLTFFFRENTTTNMFVVTLVSIRIACDVGMCFIA